MRRKDIRLGRVEGVNNPIRQGFRPKVYRLDGKTYTLNLLPEELKELKRIGKIDKRYYE